MLKSFRTFSETVMSERPVAGDGENRRTYIYAEKQTFRTQIKIFRKTADTRHRDEKMI